MQMSSDEKAHRTTSREKLRAERRKSNDIEQADGRMDYCDGVWIERKTFLFFAGLQAWNNLEERRGFGVVFFVVCRLVAEQEFDISIAEIVVSA